MHVDIVVLRVRDHDVFALHGYFRQASVLESEHGCKEERVNQVAIVVEQLQLDGQVPGELALDNGEAFAVCRA